jgi:hypothetical protein
MFNRRTQLTKEIRLCDKCGGSIIFSKHPNGGFRPVDPWTYSKHSCIKELSRTKQTTPKMMMFEAKA